MIKKEELIIERKDVTITSDILSGEKRFCNVKGSIVHYTAFRIAGYNMGIDNRGELSIGCQNINLRMLQLAKEFLEQPQSQLVPGLKNIKRASMDIIVTIIEESDMWFIANTGRAYSKKTYVRGMVEPAKTFCIKKEDFWYKNTYRISDVMGIKLDNSNGADPVLLETINYCIELLVTYSRLNTL